MPTAAELNSAIHCAQVAWNHFGKGASAQRAAAVQAPLDDQPQGMQHSAAAVAATLPDGGGVASGQGAAPAQAAPQEQPDHRRAEQQAQPAESGQAAQAAVARASAESPAAAGKISGSKTGEAGAAADPAIAAASISHALAPKPGPDAAVAAGGAPGAEAAGHAAVAVPVAALDQVSEPGQSQSRKVPIHGCPAAAAAVVKPHLRVHASDGCRALFRMPSAMWISGVQPALNKARVLEDPALCAERLSSAGPAGIMGYAMWRDEPIWPASSMFSWPAALELNHFVLLCMRFDRAGAAT